MLKSLWLQPQPTVSFLFLLSPELEKNIRRNVGTHSISPHVWSFFRAEIFGLLLNLLFLVCWSKGFGYGFLARYGIIILTR